MSPRIKVSNGHDWQQQTNRDDTSKLTNPRAGAGKANGPVWPYSGSLEKYMANLAANTVIRGGYSNQSGTRTLPFHGSAASNASSGYWLPSLATLGAVSQKHIREVCPGCRLY
jgi:hypothetical protein